jgi:SAM-dependent methyltransferase
MAVNGSPLQARVAESNSGGSPGAAARAVNARPDAATKPRTRWARFAQANKRYCSQTLQPRLYPVGHMAALEYWFRRRTAKLPPGGALLEFGCGQTFRLTNLLRAQFSEAAGTDIADVPAEKVPAGVTFRHCTPDAIPFAAEQFDVVVIRSVIEHLDDPAKTFSEIARVTKPGGYVLMNLPNKWDYVSVIAMLAGGLKSSLLKTVVQTRWDDFPVRYRCNTRRALERVLAGSGLTVQEFTPLPSQPSYLAFFVPLYVAGAAYQFAISVLGLDVLQPAFVVRLRKEEPAAQ